MVAKTRETITQPMSPDQYTDYLSGLGLARTYVDKARYVVGGMVVIGAVASDAELVALLNKVADEALEAAHDEALEAKWQAEREADEAREAEEAAREEADYYARLEAREREAAYRFSDEADDEAGVELDLDDEADA